MPNWRAKQKKLDLFLLSSGGYIDPAFKMARFAS